MSTNRGHSVGRRRWSTVVLVTAAVLVSVATSKAVSSSEAELEIERFTLGGEVVAAEIPIGVRTGEDIDEWTERLVAVSIVNLDGTEGIAELLDAEGSVLDAVPLLADVEASAFEVEQKCEHHDCAGDLVLRVRTTDPEEGEHRFEGTVTVSASGYSDDDLGEISLSAGRPEPLDREALAASSVSTAAHELRVDAEHRVAAARVEVPGFDCPDGNLWFVARDASDPVMAQLRVVTANGDLANVAGSASDVSGACGGGTTVFWVVLSVPLDEGEVTASWALVGDPSVADATISDATVTVTMTDVLEVTEDPQDVEAIPIPASAASLHLADVIAAESTSTSAGGLEWIVVENDGALVAGGADSPSSFVNYGTVVAGPCNPWTCAEEIEFSVRYDYPGGPPEGTLAARALVYHLVTDE